MLYSDMEPNSISMLKAINKAKEAYPDFKDEISNKKYIVVLDYTQPSYKKRLYLLEDGKFLRAHHMAHGVKSSKRGNAAYADKFSNVVMSKKSSLGAMRTGGVYYGKYGKSLKLRGLVKGLNHNVYKRFIVIHPARYVTDRYIMNRGRAGQSWGCPAVDPAISSKLIDAIKGGCFVYAYNGEK